MRISGVYWKKLVLLRCQGARKLMSSMGNHQILSSSCGKLQPLLLPAFIVRALTSQPKVSSPLKKAATDVLLYFRAPSATHAEHFLPLFWPRSNGKTGALMLQKSHACKAWRLDATASVTDFDYKQRLFSQHNIFTNNPKHTRSIPLHFRAIVAVAVLGTTCSLTTQTVALRHTKSHSDPLVAPDTAAAEQYFRSRRNT